MLHDPAAQSGQVNLTIPYIVEHGSWNGAIHNQLGVLQAKLESFAKELRLVRNKLLVHSDLGTAVVRSGDPLGAFKEGADVEYFRTLQEFVNVIHQEVVGGIFTLNVAMDDNDASTFRRMLDEDCERRKELLTRLAPS